MDAADLMARLDRWLAELGKVRFTCDGETAKRARGEIVLRAIMARVAVEARAIDDTTIRSGTAPALDQLDDSLDAIISTRDLFPLTSHENLHKHLDGARGNIALLSEIIARITTEIKEAIAVAPGADIPGLFYERHMATGKNKKGIVYTPAPIVQFIVKRTMEPVLSNLLRLASTGVKNGDGQVMMRAIAGIAGFSVLDPACGTGLFLVEALKLLRATRERAEEIIGAPLTVPLASQVHGIDEDPRAVEIARFNVTIAAMIAGNMRDAGHDDHPATIASNNIIVGNAITDLALQNSGTRFDAIVGNPPYVNYKKYLDRIDRKFLEQHYRVFDGQADLSYYFFELHARLLKAGGTSGQVSSRYFIQASHARRLREFLAGQEIDEIIDMNDCDVFGGIGIHPLLFFFTKCLAAPGHELAYRNLPAMKSWNDNGGSLDLAIQHAPEKRVLQASLDAGGWCMLTTRELGIQAKFDAHPSLGDLGDVLGGAETGHDEAFAKHVVMEGGEPAGILDGKKYPLEREFVHPWLKNGDIREYHHDARHWCIYVPPDIDEATFKAQYPMAHAFLSCFKPALEGRDNGKIQVPWYAWRRPRNVKNLDASAKIVMPYKAPRLRASIDTGKAYCSYDVTVFIPRAGAPSLAYLAGVLNSLPVSWYFATRGKRMGNIYEFYSGPVSNVRVPIPDATSERSIASLVEEVTAIASRPGGASNDASDGRAIEPDLEAIQRRIDEIVFSLFELSREDIDFISDGWK